MLKTLLLSFIDAVYRTLLPYLHFVLNITWTFKGYHLALSASLPLLVLVMSWNMVQEVILISIAGFLFRILGHYTGQPLLGAKVVAAMLMFATVSGILMALFLNTAGGAWDNAKKYIETGVLGGKGSDSHKAAVTGDT